MTFSPDRTVRMVELTMSADQAVSTTAATAVAFDTLRGDAGHGVGLSSSAVTLTAGRDYMIQAMGAITISSAGAVTWRWYNTATSSYLTAAQGAGDGSHSATYALSVQDQSESMLATLTLCPSVDTTLEFHVAGKTGTLRSSGSRMVILEAK